jgi:hypothetical protein
MGRGKKHTKVSYSFRIPKKYICTFSKHVTADMLQTNKHTRFKTLNISEAVTVESFSRDRAKGRMRMMGFHL